MAERIPHSGPFKSAFHRVNGQADWRLAIASVLPAADGMQECIYGDSCNQRMRELRLPFDGIAIPAADTLAHKKAGLAQVTDYLGDPPLSDVDVLGNQSHCRIWIFRDVDQHEEVTGQHRELVQPSLRYCFCKRLNKFAQIGLRLMMAGGIPR